MKVNAKILGLIPFTAKETNRWAMKGVKLSGDGKRARAEATDGRLAATMSCDSSLVLDLPDEVLDRTSLDACRKIMGKSKTIKVEAGDKDRDGYHQQVSVSGEDGQQCKVDTIPARFPDVDDACPVYNSDNAVSIAIQPEFLERAAKLAKSVVGKNPDDEHKYINITVPKNGLSPMKLDFGDGEVECSVLIMPGNTSAVSDKMA